MVSGLDGENQHPRLSACANELLHVEKPRKVFFNFLKFIICFSCTFDSLTLILDSVGCCRSLYDLTSGCTACSTRTNRALSYSSMCG